MNDTAANPVTTNSPTAPSLREALATPAIRDRLGWAALLGAFLFSMLWGIRSFGIQDNNEGLYAEIAREMNARGDWVVPHLNGAPYLEKPPLLYWIEAVLLRVFGEHEWAVRLGPVLCFAGTLAAVLWISRQVRIDGAGRKAALLLCSAAGVVGMSRSLLFDGPLTCALTWALGFFLQWRLTGWRRSLQIAYALLGVGVMAKGLLAVVLGGGTMFLATFFARRSWRDLVRVADPVGLAAFAAIVVPWHVLASLREPGFANFYFINEHLRRFLGSREPHDFYTGPIYYYLVRLPLYLGVWFFALPVLWRRRTMPQLAGPAAEARRVFGWMAALALAFFSVSEGKANYYLLTVMPAIALVLALSWPRDGLRHSRILICSAGVALFGCVFAFAPIVFAHKPNVAVLLDGMHPLLATVAILLLTLAGAIAWLGRRARNNAAFACLAAAGLVVLLPLPTVLQRADATLSQRAVAQYLGNQPDTAVVLYRDYEALSSFVFYHGHPVPVVDSESNELYYARQRYGGSRSFMDVNAVRALAHQQPVWIVTTPHHARQALQQFGGDSVRVAREFPRAVVLALGETSGAPQRAAVATTDGSFRSERPERVAAHENRPSSPIIATAIPRTR